MSGNRRIDAVVFDLDDTLYPERDYVRSGYRAAAGRLMQMLAREGAAGPPGAPQEWLWQRFESGKTAHAFDALNEAFGLGLSGDQICELVRAYRNHRPQIRPYGGVRGMLGRLHARYRLGLLSDGFLPAQQLKLDALKLGRFFDAVVFTERLGRDCWKPSPAGFDAIRAELDVRHDACAYVADNPSKDFIAPNQRGWRTVQYLQAGQIHAGNPPAEAGRPDVVARSPAALWEALLGCGAPPE